jgi:amino acid permease
LTRTAAVLSVISSIVGGGIVSLPHSYYFTGIILGTVLIVLAAAQTTYSIHLYLKAKEYLPGNPQTMHEIGFKLFNRSSIFMISGVLTFTSFGANIIYFMVFSGTFSSLIMDVA